MDQQLLRERIIQMAGSAGLLVVDEDEHRLIRADTCWVDARMHCPYGQPGGQYVNRPEAFCNEDCNVFNDNVHAPELGEEARNEVIQAHFKEHRVSVISELGARADELPKGSPERMALELAADVISENNMDRHILLEDDLPPE